MTAKPRRRRAPPDLSRLGTTEKAVRAMQLRQQKLAMRERALHQRDIREQRQRAGLQLRAATRAGVSLLRILGEGDSWMSYQCGIGLFNHVKWALSGRAACLNLAHSGDTMAQMMRLPARAELDRQLKAGIDGAPWDVLLFSGGGNDVAGDEFVEWLKPWVRGMTPADAIDPLSFGGLLASLGGLYDGLAQRVQALSPGTRVLLNGYDFAIPNGRGVLLAGPWMSPGFTAKSYDVTPLKFRTQVVKLMLQQFAATLQEVCARHPFMKLMPTQGVLKPKEWANELHPTNEGFAREAAIFVTELKTMLDSVVRPVVS